MPRPSLIPLFERLAGGADARCHVVTPTRRLARALAREFDGWQTARGRAVWESAAILPYAAFVAQLYDGAQHDPSLTGIRAPLSAAQEGALWDAVVESSGVALASTAGAAQLAAEAWLLAHQWKLAGRLRAYSFTEDTRVFSAWAADYRQRLDAIGAVDQARLPDEVALLLADGRLRPPADVVLVGFDELTPQQNALFTALANAGTRCQSLDTVTTSGCCMRAPATDARDELARLADWVAARLAANPDARIGIVVPDLAARRRSLTRALDAALEPDALLAAADRLRPYTVSLGAPLADAPLVAAALGLCRLLAGEVEFADASALIRSRYMAFGPAADVERFDIDWRSRSGRLTSLERMLLATVSDRNVAHPIPRPVLQALVAWRQKHRHGRRRPSEWAALLTEALRVAGFPGAGALDSAEYQTLARWRELMGEFAALERVQSPVTLAGAVIRLCRLAGSTVYQPEGGAPPVQVLGLLEARGLAFDHVWIAGLTSETWPPSSRPHPLLPLELQRAEGMPGADPVRDLARARATLERLGRSAPEVIASHATRDGDRDVAASSMIAAWPNWTPEPSAPRAIDALVPAKLEVLVDAQAPPLDAGAGAITGGTAIVTDQSACPFRAFGKHRLRADEPGVPHDGLDASERGQLVHGVLAAFWEGLPQRTRAHVASLNAPTRLAALERAADQAVAAMQDRRLGALAPALARLEKQRLVGLADAWLRYELEHRSDFEVAACEEWRVMAVGPLSLRGRLDRVDRLPNGRTVIIDYKTGNGAGVRRCWLGPRPTEPQLPLYLVATEPDACAVAFARIRAGEQRFVALAEEESLLPGARTDWKEQSADWPALVASWNAGLTRLAEDFAAGRAAVDPVRGAQTCRNCGLAPACRLNERIGDVDLEAEVTDER